MASPVDLATLVKRHRGHAPSPQGSTKKRIVIRLSREDITRLDTLRERLKTPSHKPSRAAVVRAFVAIGLDTAEAQGPSTQGSSTPEGKP